MQKITKALQAIQQELKVGKTQKNEHGDYNYRNLSDILQALKPSLAKTKTVIHITDTIEMIGDRFYVKAAATIASIENEETIQVTAYARETESRKGMDQSQITGAASSYARKYALNGLLAIDDTKDADGMDNSAVGNYWPDENRVAEFANLLEHPAFTGRKTDAKDKWKNCQSDESSDRILDFMKTQIQQFEEK